MEEKKKRGSGRTSPFNRNSHWILIKEILEENHLLEIIKKKMEKKHHSPAMIGDWLRRDFPEIYLKFPITPCMLKSVLLKYLGFKYDQKSYLHLKSEVRFQYKYPKGTTRKAIREDLSAKSTEGQKITAQLRKQKGGAYNPKQSVHYWINQGLDEENAKKALIQYKKECSPLSMEFYKKRNIPVEEAVRLKQLYNEAGTIKSQSYTQNPKTETIIEEYLIENKIVYQKQFQIKLDRTEQQFRTYYLYDFLIENQYLVECNGTYWHCDPRFYENKDILKLPEVGEITAEFQWLKDQHKEFIALKRGFQFLTLWETEIKNNNYEKELSAFLGDRKY